MIVNLHFLYESLKDFKYCHFNCNTSMMSFYFILFSGYIT